MKPLLQLPKINSDRIDALDLSKATILTDANQIVDGGSYIYLGQTLSITNILNNALIITGVKIVNLSIFPLTLHSETMAHSHIIFPLEYLEFTMSDIGGGIFNFNSIASNCLVESANIYNLTILTNAYISTLSGLSGGALYMGSDIDFGNTYDIIDAATVYAARLQGTSGGDLLLGGSIDGQNFDIYNFNAYLNSLGGYGGTLYISSDLDINDNILRVSQVEETFTDDGNSGTAQTIDLLYGTHQEITLTGNCTFTMPAHVAGKSQSFTYDVKTGAGGFTGVFTGVKWANNIAPTLTVTASKKDKFFFQSNGTVWDGSYTQNYPL